MPSRRMIVLGGLGAAGALVVGYAIWPNGRIAHADRIDAKAGEKFVTNWIKIATDNRVTVVVPHCDMGTGIFTALPQMAADELDADWNLVRVETAPTDPVFANGAMIEGFAMNGKQPPKFLKGIVDNTFRFMATNLSLPGAGYVPQITGGSAAVRFTGTWGMRVAGAAAREMLIKAASSRWDVSTDECSTANSHVIHTASGRRFTYGELASDAAEYTPSATPKLKTKAQFKLIGKSIPRVDIPMKVNGTTHYGIDTQLPGMLYAAIQISPVFGAKLKAVSIGDAMRQRGVKKIVQLEDAVVVIADRYWRAKNVANSLNPVFETGPNNAVTSAAITSGRLAALGSKDLKNDLKKGDGAAALSQGRIIEATYHVPYLAHATMEPMNTTAHYRSDGTLEVWAGTQDGLGSRYHCAQTAGLSMDKVTFHQRPLGGGFGRRLPGQYNYLEYAVKTAMAMPDVPVKLIFTREQDMQHDFYRPNYMSRFKASLDAQGMPIAWVNDYAGDEGANGEAHIVYGVPHQSINAIQAKTHVPTGAWRSVEASWHGFFIESFVDELAHAAGKDPVEYRLALLKDSPRHANVIRTAASAAGWNTPLPKGKARGIAMFEAFQSIVAHVVEVELTPDGTPKVNRVVSAVDCGMVVNPDGFKAQIEGGIIFGLTAALHGDITIDKGAVVQQSFPDYQMVKLDECPEIEVHIVESDGPVGGAGEPGVPPTGPAIANAIFALTGVRQRELPIKPMPLASSQAKSASL